MWEMYIFYRQTEEGDVWAARGVYFPASALFITIIH